MRAGIWRLALERVRHEKKSTLVLVLCLALPMFLFVASRLFFRGYERELVGRADATPLLLGPKGDTFDLVLGSLYLRGGEAESVPWSEFRALEASGEGLAIPLRLGFTARGRPILGTTPEYYERHGLRAATGTLPLLVGDCVLGARLAERLGLAPGATLFSDPRELYDISKPPALELGVVGVLARAGGPEDDAVLVDVKTTWALEGLLHGHADPGQALDPKLLLGRDGDNLVLSEALLSAQHVSRENLASFHAHGDEDAFPLTSVAFWPRDAKAATLATTRVGLAGRYRMVAPRAVIDELISFVLELRGFLDRLALLLAFSTALLVALILMLSVRLRRHELDQLQRIGIARRTLVGLVALELVLVLAASVVFTAAALGAAALFLPDVQALIALR